MQALRRILIVAAATTALGACAPVTDQSKHSMPATSETTLAVENGNWVEASIYVVRGTHRTRLGTARSMTTTEFVIPADFMVGTADITVQADPAGNQPVYTSPRIQVYPGARLVLRVRNQPQHSDFSVFPGVALR